LQTNSSSYPAKQNYLDFEVEIGPGSGREYPVAVIRSPAGEARETMRFPYDELTLESRLDKLQIALLRSGGKRRQALSQEEQAVQTWGRDLFDALFTGEIRSRYDVSQREAAQQGKGLRVKLRIQSPELAALPWEFLYDARQAEYVCLSRNTPVVRYLELPQPIRPLTVTPPLRILGMIASPSDLSSLDVAREKQRVDNAIEDLRKRGLVELVWLEGQTWRDLQRAMRGGPWHVFHFIGHGGFDARADEGLIVLADERGQAAPLTATQLGLLLADHRSLRLVLLNACEGARGSQRDIFSSTSSILVRRGLPAALAMQYEITDRAAIEFSRAFYEALADEMPVDTAVAEARKAIRLAVANTVEWGTPVLYMRSPDGMLFDLRGQPQRPTPVAPATPKTPAVTPAPTPKAGATRVAEKDGMVMVYVPAGEFMMGSADSDKDASDGEKPQHKVHLDAFWIDQTPVTNTMFARFVAETGHKTDAEKEGWGYAWTGSQWKQVKGADWQHPHGPKTSLARREDHPVVQVSWNDAQDYCRWAGRRLPTEAEWEKAARGADGRIYPWGKEMPDSTRCNFNMNIKDTTSVGSYPAGASPYGALDMAGNVWEWASDWYDEKYYGISPPKNPTGPTSGQYRVLRGGSWVNEAQTLCAANRDGYNPENRNNNVGFRCSR